MRMGFALAIATCLAGSPAFADVAFGPDHDGIRHEERVEHERDAAHRDRERAREHAEAAREDADAARDREHRVDNDRDRGGVRLEVGH